MIQICIPPTLRRFCGGEAVIPVRAQTVDEAFGQLHARFNGIRERLCDEEGRIRGSVLVFVNDEDVRFLDAQRTRVRPGDQISIVPAYAGG